MKRRGAVTAGMIDKAIPPRCLAEAREEVRKRTGAWIHRATIAIQMHNDALEQPGNNGRCHRCGSDASLIWETP